MYYILSRICNSHNLNVSPFCNLGKATSPTKWAGDVKELYAEEDKPLPEYIEQLESPLRESYPSEEFKNNEMMTNLAEVQSNDSFSEYRFFLQV